MNAIHKIAIAARGAPPRSSPAPPRRRMQINGAGATFPNPIYSKWFSEYNKQHPNVEINYQSIGSGGGIQQVTKQTVFFGATDGPMTAEQLQGAPGKILHFPDGARRRRPGLQSAERHRRAEVQRAGARRHLPRQDHEVERSGDREAERRRHAAGHRHHRRASRRRLRHDLHLGRLSVEAVAGVEEQGRRRHVGELADRRRRPRQRRRVRAGEADARRDRLRRADLRAAEQDRVRQRA